MKISKFSLILSDGSQQEMFKGNGITLTNLSDENWINGCSLQYNMLLFDYSPKKEKLLKNPYLNLRKDNGEIVTVYLDKIKYDKLKKYDYNKLISENKKIRIKAEVTELKFDTLKIYKVDGKISVEKLDGKTYWKK